MNSGPPVKVGQIFLPEKEKMAISVQKSQKPKRGKWLACVDTVKRRALCSGNYKGAFCFLSRPPQVGEAIEITAVHSHYLVGKLVFYEKIKDE